MSRWLYGLNEAAKEALRAFDEQTGQTLKKQGTAEAKPKKKGFKDKIKEAFDEM